MLATLIMMTAMTASVSLPTCCPIVELRQYTLLPDRRDPFVTMFEREFIETQEETGIRVIGQFRDLDNPNHFVWLRGFPDMPHRADWLQAFYGGPVWKANRDAANANFTDTDNVLLLHAVAPTSQFKLDRMNRAAMGANADPHGVLIATIYYFDAPADHEFVEFFEKKIAPALGENGTKVLAYFASETSANNFPRLPVREKDHVFVWFALYPSLKEYETYRAKLDGSDHWHAIAPELRRQLLSAPEVLRLTPTPRSLLHG
jgi:NIPSNAP